MAREFMCWMVSIYLIWIMWNAPVDKSSAVLKRVLHSFGELVHLHEGICIFGCIHVRFVKYSLIFGCNSMGHTFCFILSIWGVIIIYDAGNWCIIWYDEEFCVLSGVDIVDLNDVECSCRWILSGIEEGL